MDGGVNVSFGAVKRSELKGSGGVKGGGVKGGGGVQRKGTLQIELGSAAEGGAAAPKSGGGLGGGLSPHTPGSTGSRSPGGTQFAEALSALQVRSRIRIY